MTNMPNQSLKRNIISFLSYHIIFKLNTYRTDVFILQLKTADIRQTAYTDEFL